MSEDGFDKTQIVVFLVVVAIVATIGISVFSQVGDISGEDIEEAQNQTADPYDGPDYNPYGLSPLPVAGLGVMSFAVIGFTVFRQKLALKDEHTSIEEGDRDD
jgi:hypothetical protein